ncbi:MAG: hypothetical protein KC643_27755 [Nitrospira sp.]|nr:hypothetical protein [Nitrospira sp.]
MSFPAIIGGAVILGVCWLCSRYLPEDPMLKGVNLNPFQSNEWDWQLIIYWVVFIGLALLGLSYLSSGSGGLDEWDLPSHY